MAWRDYEEKNDLAEQSWGLAVKKRKKLVDLQPSLSSNCSCTAVWCGTANPAPLEEPPPGQAAASDTEHVCFHGNKPQRRDADYSAATVEAVQPSVTQEGNKQTAVSWNSESWTLVSSLRIAECLPSRFLRWFSDVFFARRHSEGHTQICSRSEKSGRGNLEYKSYCFVVSMTTIRSFTPLCLPLMSSFVLVLCKNNHWQERRI